MIRQTGHGKLNILIFADYYLPGFKAGGPIKTLSNLVDQLGDEFHFKIVTRDRDIDDRKPFFEDTQSWRSVGKAEVRYLSPEQSSLISIGTLLAQTPYDILYLNSLFSPHFTIYPLISHKISSNRNVQVILAPRGEVADSAVKIKSYKKAPFLKLAKWFGLYDNIKWHASSEFEAENVHGMFDSKNKIAKVKYAPNVVIAPDLPERLNDIQLQSLATNRTRKEQNKLNIVFLARVARMKNLDGALKILQGVCGEIKFDIYGPLEDREYWAECENLIKKLPPNIEVRHKGPVNSKDVHAVLSTYHLFFLPTLGENFGHVILEALIAGCPVLISDRTPWRDLEKKGVGWEISLSAPEIFQKVLHECVEMDQESLASLSRQAVNFAKAVANDENNLMLNRKLFLEA